MLAFAVGGAGSATAAPEPTEPGTAVPVPIDAGHDSEPSSNNSKFAGPLQHTSNGVHQVFVQVTGQGAAQTATQKLAAGAPKADAKESAKAQARANENAADSVFVAARALDPQADELFAVSNAVPGVGIRATKGALDALAARGDVVKISALVPKKINNAGTAQLTRVLDTWQNLGVTGEGIKVGVIDTGIDYTHADFGGPGTVDAWNAAHAASDAPFTPTAKVVGGFDFVGDDYDAGNDGSQPKPDPNPLDCEGHGTHVAGTAAGYGVGADGTTFRGDYASLNGDDLYKMKVAPGMAPKASLYGLKVFGCVGSTNAVIPALDWALDPNGDGDFSDHLDIVNLSLGSDYGAVDDPENDVINEVAANGVLPVISMGNNGDLTDTGGAPGNAVRSLAVASSVDGYQLRDGLKINAPAGLADVVAGQVSIAYPWSTAPDVTGDVVPLSTGKADGCDPLSPADAAVVAGKIAWLEWDDNDATRRCGSATRSANVQQAGAIGAIFTSELEVFGAGISGSAVIPVFQLPKTGTELLRPALEAGTLTVSFSGSLVATITDRSPAIADTISSFTSRGTHGSIGVVKPDVAAPGDTVASAKIGSGNGVVVESGTSMAAPLTTGIAALVKKVHPTWSTEQLKAAIMNTAGHDLWTDNGQQGDRYGPARVGAGRVDALSAVQTTVIAYNSDVEGGVSASFGVVEAPIGKKSVARVRTIKIQNTGRKSVRLSLAYDGLVQQPGVSYAVTPSAVTLKKNATAKVKVVMTVQPSGLRHTLDPTMATQQTDSLIGADRARQFVSDASGRVLITQSGQPDLRVPVHGAAKPVSTTKSRAVTSRTGTGTIQLRGDGFDQGGGSERFASQVSVLNLGSTSRRLPTCSVSTTNSACTFNATTVAGDIHHVGANATADHRGSKANGWLWFGVSTYGNWATIGNSTTPYVDIDTGGDAKPEFEVFVQNEPSTDLLTAYLVDLRSNVLLDIEPVNFHDGDVDTNVFDTDTLLIPVWPKLIGLTDTTASFPIRYTVGTFSAYGSSALGGDIDRTPAVTFDAAKPTVQVADPLFYDASGVGIPYRLNGSAASAKALVLHLHGKSGSRAEVVSVR